MSTEDIVRSSMDQAVTDLRPTVPDPASLRARVNRRSRAQAFAAVGLAAVVTAGVVLGIVAARDDDRSAPPPATTQDPDVEDIGVEPVWMVDGVLHIGDQAFPQDKEIATALIPVKSGAVYGASDGTIVYQPVGGPAEVIEYPTGRDITWGPAAGPDTDVVAMFVFSKVDGSFELSMYDLERDREITAIPVYDRDLDGADNPAGGESVAPIDWVGADPDGGFSALFTGPSLDYSGADDPVKGDPVVLRMHPRGYRGAATTDQLTPAAHDVTIEVLADARANGLSFRTPGGKTLSSVDGVKADGGLSHDGAFYAGSGTEGGIAVVDTRTGTTRHLDAPEGTVPRNLSWAGGHTLMFHAVDDAGASSAGSVMACNADTLRCAVVADVDDIDRAVLPRL